MGPTYHFQPRGREAGDLTGDDAGHGEASWRWEQTQRRAAVPLEVEGRPELHRIADDKEMRRSCFGRRSSASILAPIRAERRGKRVRGTPRLYRGGEEDRSRPVTRDRRSSAAAAPRLISSTGARGA